jgi:hypothetical protein
MMSDLRKAAEEALAFLTALDQDDNDRDFLNAPQCYALDRAMKDLRAALAVPEQEPVAWRKRMLPTDYDYDGNDWRFSESGFIEPAGQEPLYTAPTAQTAQTPPRLTDEDVSAKWSEATNEHGSQLIAFARAIESAVRRQFLGRDE